MLHAILDSTPDAVIVADQDSKVVEYNNAAELMFGYRREEVLGHVFHDLLHLESVARHLRPASDVRRQRVNDVGVHKDGFRVPVELSLSSYEDQGRVRFVAIIRDVTEREQEAADLAVAATQVAVAAEALARRTVPVTDEPIRILVVDDNVESADALMSLLRQEGHLVWCGNTPAALKIAEKFDPEILIIDISFPHTNAAEVCDQIRAVSPSIRVVAITNADASADQFGFHDYVTKPVESNKLASVIQKHKRK